MQMQTNFFVLRGRARAQRVVAAVGMLGAALILAMSSPAQAEAKAADGDNPVVRAASGLWGMQFTFGGLATMSHTNSAVANTGTLVVTQIGMRMVRSENVIIPLFFGFGTNLVDPPGDDNAMANIGVRLGGGLEYHFRIWRRISPFLGGYGVFDYGNPSGGRNWSVGLTLLPTLGVEYYWGDRVSFIAQYFFGIGFQYQKAGEEGQISFGVSTSAGGQLSINFYF